MDGSSDSVASDAMEAVTRTSGGGMRLRNSHQGIQLPLSQEVAQHLHLVVVDGETGLEVDGQGLADLRLAASMSDSVRTRLQSAVDRHLAGACTGAEAAPWLDGLSVQVTPAAADRLTARCATRLRKHPLAGRRVALADLLKGASGPVDQPADLLALLAIAERHGAGGASQEVVRLEAGRRQGTRAPRLSARSRLEPPVMWRPEGDGRRRYEFVVQDDLVVVHEDDVRLAWWLSCLSEELGGKHTAVWSCDGDDLVRRGLVSPHAHLALMAREVENTVVAGVAMTASDEMVALIEGFAAGCKRPDRLKRVMRLRYGLEGRALSYDECASVMGGTSAGLHSMVRKAVQRANERTWAPALRRVVADADQAPDVLVANLQRRLQPVLGGVALPDALAFADEVLGIRPAAAMRVVRRGSDRRGVAVMDSPRAKLVLACATQLNLALKAAGIVMAQCVLSMDESTSAAAGDKSLIDEAVSMVDAACWVPSSRCWVMDASAEGRLGSVVGAMLRLADGSSLSLDRMADGLERLIHGLAQGTAGVDEVVPSPGLLVRAVERVCLELPCARHGQEVTWTGSFEEPLILSRQVERDALDLLREGGGFRADLVAALVDRGHERARESVRGMFFVERDAAGHRLIGIDGNSADHPPAAAKAAASEVKALPRSSPDRFVVSEDRSKVVVLMRNAGEGNVPLKKRLVYLPTNARALVQGAFEHQGRTFGGIDVVGVQVRRLAAVVSALGVGPGEAFRVEFDLVARNYGLLLGDDRRSEREQEAVEG